jgi:hypothetical protein
MMVLLAIAAIVGCSEDVFLGEPAENRPPTVRLTNGPLEGDTTLYQVHFYWVGYDPDGTVEYYEYAVAAGDPTGFDPADTTGADKWTATELTDMIITVSADRDDGTVTIGSNRYAHFSRVHTLFIRAVDNGGLRSETAHRSFTAFTLAPWVVINEPYLANPSEKVQYLTPVIHFAWEGKDPLDTPWNYQDVDSVRYLHTRYSGSVIDHLNAYPELFEEKWSPWIAYEAPGDSGRSTILGDDETIDLGFSYIFAVQAKDEAGAITSIFDARTNVRCFIVKKPTGPLLTVYEPYLGIERFLGTASPVAVAYVPAGLPIRYSWFGDASDYGGTVSTYRYGWDIKDLADPADWAVEPNP